MARRKAPVEEIETVDAEIVDEPGTDLEIASRSFTPAALGDTIYLQLLRAITGYGNAGDVIQTVETVYIEAMIANGYAAVVTGPVAVVPSSPTSLRWQPYTTYPANWVVINPSGQLVAANVSFVSGASYVAGNWTVINDTGAGGSGGAVSSVAGKTGAVSLVSGDIGGFATAAAAAAPVTSIAGRTGAVTLAKADVGLPAVDNTADTVKPISTAQQAALDVKIGQYPNPITLHTEMARLINWHIGSDPAYGMVADNGVTDNGPALAALLAAGGVSIIPAGNYGFATANITIPPGANIQGAGGGSRGTIVGTGQRTVFRRFDAGGVPLFRYPQGTGPTKLVGVEIDGRSVVGDALVWDDGPTGGEETIAVLNDLYIHDTGADAARTMGDAVKIGVGRRGIRGEYLWFVAGRNALTLLSSDSTWRSFLFIGANHGLVLGNGSGSARMAHGEIYGCGSTPAVTPSKSITACTATATPTITVANHGLQTGDTVDIRGSVGNTAINALWTVTVVDANTFTVAAAASGTWTSGGTVQLVGYGVYVPPNVAPIITFVDLTIDRNWFAGIMLDRGSNLTTWFGTTFTTNGRFADSYSANIENNAGNSGHAFTGSIHGPLSSVSTNRVVNGIRTQNSTNQIETGATYSTSAFASGSFTNAWNQLLAGIGQRTFLSGSTATPTLTSRQVQNQTADAFQPQWFNGVRVGQCLDFAGRPVYSSGNGSPVVAVGSAAGTGAPTATLASGSDAAGRVQIVTGSGGASTGPLAQVTFASAYGVTPQGVTLTLQDGGAPAAWTGRLYATRSTTGFNICTDTALPTGTTLNVLYQVIG